MKPGWCPENLWAQLAPYTKETRRRDPTDGFMLRCCRHHPDFDMDVWKSKSDGAKRTYMKKVLGIPKTKIDEQQKDAVNR